MSEKQTPPEPEPCFCGNLDHLEPDERTKVCEEIRQWLAQLRQQALVLEIWPK